MDLEDHWRKARRARARGPRPRPDPESARDFRHEIEARLNDKPGWAHLPNPALAALLNELRLKTYEARSWDAASARSFRLAIETELKKRDRQQRSAADAEQERISKVAAFARDALIKSGQPGRSAADIEADTIKVGLDLAEDRNRSIAGLSRALDILLKRHSRALLAQAGTQKGTQDG